MAMVVRRIVNSLSDEAHLAPFLESRSSDGTVQVDWKVLRHREISPLCRGVQNACALRLSATMPELITLCSNKGLPVIRTRLFRTARLICLVTAVASFGVPAESFGAAAQSQGFRDRQEDGCEEEADGREEEADGAQDDACTCRGDAGRHAARRRRAWHRQQLREVAAAALQARRHRRPRARHPRRGGHHLQPGDRRGALGVELAEPALDRQHHQGDDRGGLPREQRPI